MYFTITTDFLSVRTPLAAIVAESPESGKLIFPGQKERPAVPIAIGIWTLEK